jgi:hypothetical protein
MSGGSFNYLFQSELTSMQGLVEAMRDRLKELGHPEAAARTEDVVQRMREINAIQQELETVWRAVEWQTSGDAGVGAVNEAVAKWMIKPKSE